MYGGTTIAERLSRQGSGLSPRVRGNLICQAAAKESPRSIPACTGNPAGLGNEMEDIRSIPACTGNPKDGAGARTEDGSIPACTGEPCHTGASVLSARVYPRVYGGTDTLQELQVRTQGLSPRVRGNLLTVPGDTLTERSIPACTGEPRSGGSGVSLRAVYPRVYGGTLSRSLKRHHPGGLSPRVRGNHRESPPERRGKRSIPACTGEPPLGSSMTLTDRVYPRVYGGTPALVCKRQKRPGLSPRVRGNQVECARGFVGERSIPACTGEPSRVGVFYFSLRVYPRVYGGTSCVPIPPSPRCGLSPRVRGNHRESPPERRGERSIPACTGEPVVSRPVI